ncbi:MAG TPA: cytochrome c oxidase assembly protein [Actinomycetota bacterium]|nr:cytochrome c oxidase assembly protein [Actinomycetota bacterium]
MTSGVVLTHGDVPPAPSAGDAFTAWTFDPFVWVAVAGAAWLYARGARKVGGWPRGRSWCAAAGLAVVLVAASGPPAVYEGSLFWVHMVQHLLLTLVAAPLLAFSSPVVLALRAATPRRRARLVRLVHARRVRALMHPLVGWTVFGAVMWGTHFSGLYDAALEDDLVHGLEHALYLGAALLFWAPVAGAAPAARPARPARVAYLLAAIPVQSFLGLAVYSAHAPLYDHYATLTRTWGPKAADDQKLAGAVMWIGGDVALLAWTGVAAAAWLRAEEREGEKIDRREKAPPP